MAKNLEKEKPDINSLAEMALKFGVMLSEIYSNEKDKALKTLIKAVKTLAIDAPSSNGAKATAEETDFIEEGLHVMFNGEPWDKLEMNDVPEYVKQGLNLVYEQFKYFAAPANYTQDEMVEAGKAKKSDTNANSISYDIGFIDGITGDTTSSIYDNKLIEMFIPVAFNNSDLATRTKGKYIQDSYLEKCGKLVKIIQATKSMMKRLYKTTQDHEFSLNQYGQLLYAMYLKGKSPYTGWHRGVDVNYKTGPKKDYPPIYNLADGIVVGRSTYTMLDVYVPNDNVTITYMHFRPTNNPDDTTRKNWPKHLTLGKRLQQFQYIGLQDCCGVNQIHVHIEINKGCCYSSGNKVSKSELAEAIENYYDELILESGIEEQLYYLHSESQDDQEKVQNYFNKKRNKIEMERNMRNGTQLAECDTLIEEYTNHAQTVPSLLLRKRGTIKMNTLVEPRKIDTSYSIYTTSFDSLYPYDYYNKWCQ